MLQALKNIFGPSSSELPRLETDIHSHLIPGIDDGSKSMDESIAMIRTFSDLGYKKLITTPHIMKHRYPNTKESILEGLEAVQKAVAEAKIDMVIEAASEYYLDEHVMELVEKKEILTFGENYMLFEFSYVQAPHHLEEMIFEIKVAGYKPVLAHPERYVFMHSDFSKYESLKAKGVLFQMNIPSLGGYYSPAVAKVAKKIVAAGMVDFLGSDCHKDRHLGALQKVRQSREYAKVFVNNTILNHQL